MTPADPTLRAIAERCAETTGCSGCYDCSGCSGAGDTASREEAIESACREYARESAKELVEAAEHCSQGYANPAQGLARLCAALAAFAQRVKP